MKTRRSPRNQEILWRTLGGPQPTPPKRLSISRIKPVFDWDQNRMVDPTDASYLDRLGTSSAKDFALSVLKNSAETGLVLPADDRTIERYLEDTLVQLSTQKKINWPLTPDLRRQVFVNAWASEMTRQGIRA